MSKEYLEAFRDILGILSAVSGCEVDMDSERVKIVKQALHRLEAIDNSNPSEALECLEYIENKLKDLEYIAKQNDNEYLLSKYIPSEKFTTIKQALLKAQEPKQYLKWEDLEFTRDGKVILVKMGDTGYKISYRCCDGIEEVHLLSEDEKLLYLNFIGKYKDNIQVFNDLHLERVEE